MAASSARGFVTITLEMLRFAVEILQMRRSGVTSKMIAQHLTKNYPIDQNLDDLKNELKSKLDHAVSVGILSRCASDTYCLATFRQQAYNYKTDLSSFWERYYKKRPGRSLRPPPKKQVVKQDNYSDDSSDDFSESDD